MKKLVFFLWLILPSLLGAQTEHMVLPNTADPLSAAPNNYHFAYTKQTLTQKNKLVLFFPGTGAVPYNYKEFIKLAANLGYHAIGLCYPNSEAINQICASSTDTTCHSRARLEVFDGIDRHADVHVDSNNCIERRTLKLLKYLHLSFPSENWSQFYSGNQILWNKIVVSGHSQGGGHAGLISKIKPVDRVLMFAAIDWISLLTRNADWITWPGATAKNKYYGFIHQNDESVDFNLCLRTWTNYGLTDFGQLTLADSSNNPYNGTHMLYTKLTPANDPSKFHGSVAADAYTPMNAGVPVFIPLWTYLLEGNVTSIESNTALSKLSAFPNPVHSTLQIMGTTNAYLNYTLFNMQGLRVLSGRLDQYALDLSTLQAGIYFLQLDDSPFSSPIKLFKE